VHFPQFSSRQAMRNCQFVGVNSSVNSKKEYISTPTSINLGKAGIFMQHVQQNNENFEEDVLPHFKADPPRNS
jgi:hypothetical protein